MADKTFAGPGGFLKTLRLMGDGSYAEVVALGDVGYAYETVAASQTAQVLGGAGAIGDYLAGILVTPLTLSPGAVSIKDGAGSAVVVFQGGASTLTDVKPFFIPISLLSAAGAWALTTGANVQAIGIGRFSA